MKRQSIHLLLFCLFGACTSQQKHDQSSLKNNYYTQAKTNRTAAEWEPTKGTMLVWPLCVPYKPADDETHFYADIPAKKGNISIEYYISAASKSGKMETMPRTAPIGLYTAGR